MTLKKWGCLPDDKHPHVYNLQRIIEKGLQYRKEITTIN
jgi:hypothetical protein